MVSRKLAIIGLTMLIAAGANSVLAWQYNPPLPDAPESVDSVDSGYQPTHPIFANDPQVPFGAEYDYDNPMYDTSLIPRWNRRFEYEGAAGTPPGRAWWVPSAMTGHLLWLNRTGADPSVLLTGGVLNTVTLAVDHSTAVTMSDLEAPVEAGTRLSVLLGRAGNWQPELAYLGVFDQNASVRYAPIASTGVIETGANFFDLTIFNPVTDITVSYEGDLHSAECNFWYDDGWRFQTLIGARWIQFSEEFEQYETADWADRTFAESTNTLLGGQVGFRTFLFERGKLSAFVIAKGGVYHNDTRLVADIQSGGAVLNSMEQSDNSTAYAGELNLTAVWQLTPYFNFHCGYTGLWLSEVALVGDQLNDLTFAAGGGTFDYGGVSYQGGHLGVTFAW